MQPPQPHATTPLPRQAAAGKFAPVFLTCFPTAPARAWLPRAALNQTLKCQRHRGRGASWGAVEQSRVLGSLFLRRPKKRAESRETPLGSWDDNGHAACCLIDRSTADEVHACQSFINRSTRKLNASSINPLPHTRQQTGPSTRRQPLPSRNPSGR